MSVFKEKLIDIITASVNKRIYVSRKDIKNSVERFIVTVSIVSVFFFFGVGLYVYNENVAKETIKYEMDIKLIDLDIKRDNSLRLYYDEKLAEGYKLTIADQKHLKRINQRLERNYARIEILNENLDIIE